MSAGIDYPLEETVHLLFTTRAFATGIPGTLSASTVAVYEDGTATPIMTSVAVTEDLNSIVGLNMVPIVATAVNGFNTGASYHVVIEAGTVDSVSVVGEVVGSFSISRSTAAVDLANATDGLSALKTLLDAIPTTAMRGTDSAATSAKQDTMETTLNAIPTTAMRGTDSAATEAKQDAQDLIITEARLAELDPANLPTDIAAIPTTAMRGTDSAATSAKQDSMETTLNLVLSDQESMGITKNATFSNFEFPMVLSSDHYTAGTGLTVTGERSIDGGAFGAVSGTIAEIGSGVYQIDLLAADTNGDVITYKFSSATCDDTIITVTTRA